MEFLLKLLSKKKVEAPKTVADHQRETLVDLGREQFQRLMELGLRTPVSLA